MSMQRATLLALLVASALFAGTVHAQRGGGTFAGGGGRITASHFGVQRGLLHGPFRGRAHHFRNFGSSIVPFWYDESFPFWYEGPFEDEEAALLSEPAPPVVIVQQDKSQSATREVPPAEPLVIEIPGKANSEASKPLPPAIFILSNGQRLEGRRYLLTADSLYVTIDRQQRTIPLAMLDIDSTVAANRARGIDLRVPADRDEISLGF